MIDCAGTRLRAISLQSTKWPQVTTGRFIYTYLGTGIYAVYTTAGAFEDSRDHGIYYVYRTLRGRDQRESVL